MAEKIPLKEQALNSERITRIGRELRAILPAFDADGFALDVLADFPRLELKARIARTSKGLRDHLPVTGTDALDVLLRSLPPTPEDAGATSDFGLHIYSPHSDYVARYCRTSENLKPALEALRRLTPYFSAEDPVRYFVKDFPVETMRAVHAWAQDPDHRVRRLASEATRPRLPWSPRIPLPIDAALPVLDQLHSDESRYVTRSVGNHLHDIAADDPDLVLATLQRWKAGGCAREKEFDFIAREALRTLLKKGCSSAYEFLGYASDAPVELSSVHLDSTELTDGDTLAFSASLSSSSPTQLHITYVISSTTKRGARREKVYFLTKTTAEPGQPVSISKQHHLRSTATTKIAPGMHALEIQVNGRRFPPTPFQVV
jgi:3-methyladenine DNA glycosylase AlkC